MFLPLLLFIIPVCLLLFLILIYLLLLFFCFYFDVPSYCVSSVYVSS